VTSLDDFWHRKYAEDESGKIRRVATGAQLAQPGNGEGVHLPASSYWPIVLAASFPIIGYGIMFTLWLTIPGGLLLVLGLYGWSLEPADDLDLPHDHDDHADLAGVGASHD
jgi:cytochrome c oxidase subunit I